MVYLKLVVSLLLLSPILILWVTAYLLHITYVDGYMWMQLPITITAFFMAAVCAFLGITITKV